MRTIDIDPLVSFGNFGVSGVYLGFWVKLSQYHVMSDLFTISSVENEQFLFSVLLNGRQCRRSILCFGIKSVPVCYLP